eukprot:PhM_4_TR4991/c0_g1_i1/m.90011
MNSSDSTATTITTMETLWGKILDPLRPDKDAIAAATTSISSARKPVPVTTLYSPHTDIFHNNVVANVNGVQSTDFKSAVAIVKDFTVLLTSSFVVLDHEVRSRAFYSKSHVMHTSGTITLLHDRPFISWTPYRDPETALLDADKMKISLPYSATVAVAGQHISSLFLVSPIASSLLQKGMPSRLAPVLANRQAMKMFFSLRGIGVKPEVISYNALLGVASKQATWGQALGIK